MNPQQLRDITAALEVAAAAMSRLSLAMETGEVSPDEATYEVREMMDNLKTLRP